MIAVGGGILIKYLKNKLNNEKVDSYYTLAKQIVMYIEQTNSSLVNEDKKQLATSKILELTNNKITEKQADTLIESAIYEVKKLINTNETADK